MNSLIKKLQIKDGYTGKIINVPKDMKDEFKKWLKELNGNKKSELDFVLVFAKNSQELGKYAKTAVKMARHDALIWFAYLKRISP